jgi:lysine 6-dehydrogenase
MKQGVVAVLGSGLMGSEIALDLLTSDFTRSILVVDSDQRRLQALKERATSRRLNSPYLKKLNTRILDISKDRKGLEKLLSSVDAAVGALPHRIAELAVLSAASVGIDFVDLIYSWRHTSTRGLSRKAERNGVTIIPACGLAPGLTNIIARNAVSELGGADRVSIYVGGIPQQPDHLLSYRILFALESVLEEYTRDAVIVRNGRKVVAPALSEVEEVQFSQLPGKHFEAFLTDGLSTLPDTLKVRNMEEKTIRWQGHAERISFLRELGLLSQEESKVGEDGVIVSPRALIMTLLQDRLAMRQEDRDMTLMRVIVTRGGKGLSYEMVDFFDTSNSTTSMARTTCYPCSTVLQLLVTGRVSKKGFVPPEVAISGENFKEFMGILGRKGLIIHKLTLD